VARAAETDFKRVKGTRDVSTLGGPDHVVRVLMDSERMNAFSASRRRIWPAALRVGNALQSSGSLVAGNREVLVETGTYLESAADVRQLVVAVRGNAGERKPVFMGDVARVEDGPISQAATSGWATVTASFRQ
jgi:multidrug efflux pump subunit AcrB